MLRVAQLLAGIVLLALGMMAPQYVYFVTHSSRVAAVLTGAVIAGLWVALMLVAGRTFRAGAVAAALGVALIVFTPVAGTADFQQALKLSDGKALDGVPLARVLGEGEENMWVRINDARVRSEVSKQLDFVSGDRGRPGQPANPTRSHIVVSPVTLAAAVSNEEPMMRSKPAGVTALWACASDSVRLSDWDRQRQAVRGRLARMEDHVLSALNRELVPARAMPMPGAFAIPAAPGAEPVAAPPVAEAPVLRAATPSWCVHLDPTTDAAAAKKAGFESLLVFLIMLPVMGAGLALGIARIK